MQISLRLKSLLNKLNNYSSLTTINHQKILDHNLNYPFDSPMSDKRELKLECCRNTVRNVLSDAKIMCFAANREPLINTNQFNLKKKWCKIMNNLDQNQWNQIVFTDEKTLQNFHNGTVKVYRKRGECNDHHTYRRTLNRFKINLFGYITSQGLGNL